MRVASSMQTRTNSQPMPRWRFTTPVHRTCCDVRKLVKRSGNKRLACVLDGVEPLLVLLVAEYFQFRDRCRLSDVLPKHGYVDILREPRNQPIGFRERGTAFEQEARPARLQSVEQSTQSPADPEILFDVLHRRTDAIGSGQEEIASLRIVRGYDTKIRSVHVDEGIWLVSFMHYDLGYIDLEQRTLQPLDNPFGPGLSPMS